MARQEDVEATGGDEAAAGGGVEAEEGVEVAEGGVVAAGGASAGFWRTRNIVMGSCDRSFFF